MCNGQVSEDCLYLNVFVPLSVDLAATAADAASGDAVDPRRGFHRRLRLQTALRRPLHQQLHADAGRERRLPPGCSSEPV